MSQLVARVKELAKKPQTSVSLREMVRFGRVPSPASLFWGSQFLLKELPVRLAHRVVELENLPHDLSQMPSINIVKNWYTQSCAELLDFEIPSGLRDARSSSIEIHTDIMYFNEFNESLDLDAVKKHNARFLECIDRIKRRHDPTTTTIGFFVN